MLHRKGVTLLLACVAAMSVTVMSGGLCWWFQGERFLSPIDPREGGILVVEGWMGRIGVEAAAVAAVEGNYTTVLAVGSRTGNGWGGLDNYAKLTAKCLRDAGVLPERIIEVGVPWTQQHRTYASALSALDAVNQRKLDALPLTLFTAGSHGRRSRLVYEKAFRGVVSTRIGVISWREMESQDLPWWKVSSRARDQVAETAAWLHEWLLNSGRPENWKP